MVADWKVSAITACPDTRRLQTDLGVLSLFFIEITSCHLQPHLILNLSILSRARLKSDMIYITIHQHHDGNHFGSSS